MRGNYSDPVFEWGQGVFATWY